jgi:hypothetical protein
LSFSTLTRKLLAQALCGEETGSYKISITIKALILYSELKCRIEISGRIILSKRRTQSEAK